MVKSTRAHRFSVIFAVVTVVSLGWSPLQAWAADELTDPVVDVVSDTTSATVDAVSDTTSSTVDAVTSTTSSTVDAVTSTTSSTVDTVTSTTSSTVGDGTKVGTAAGSAGSGSRETTGQADHTSISTGYAAGELPYRPLRNDAVLPVAPSRGHGPIDYQGPGSCVATAIAPCGETTIDGDGSGSWRGAVASIIEKLLALTGWGLLSWIAAPCILTVMGMLTLYEARRRSKGYTLGSARSA